MSMTEQEICREYRHAKHKGDMVQILAELNCTDRKDIIDILIRGGEKVRINIPGKKNRILTDDMTDKEYVKALYGRLDYLEERMRPLDSEYMDIVKIIRSYDQMQGVTI